MVPKQGIKADARPPRGAGINVDPTDERAPACDDVVWSPGSKAASDRSIRPAKVAAKDDNQQPASSDSRICRHHWPEDEATRRAQIAEILPQAIREYFGNTQVIEYRLSLRDGEIKEIAAEQPQIAADLAKAEDLLCALAEDCLARSVCEERSSADARFLLERLHPGKYARKTAADKNLPRSLDLPSDAPASALSKQPETKPHQEVQ